MAFNGNIIFNEVTLNLGNAMSSDGDGFVVPISGHYRLSFSAMGGFEKTGINTWVHVRKNGNNEFEFGDSNDGPKSDGNNISHNWIWYLNKGDKVSLEVNTFSYLRATRAHPLNFNGELVFVETSL